MKEFLSDMLIEPFTEYDRDWFSCTMGVVMWLFTIAVGGFLLWLICMPIDRMGLPEKENTGIVIGRCYSPAYIQTTMVMSGKTMIPITSYYPESWSIEIKIPAEDQSESVCVSHQSFENIPQGKQFKVRYYIGRLWRNIHITYF